MDKRTSFRINNRTETTFGIASIALGVMSILLFLVAVYQSAYNLNGRETIVGSIELAAMLMCLVGGLFGVIGEFRPDKFHRTAHAGIVINLIIGIFHVVVLTQGY